MAKWLICIQFLVITARAADDFKPITVFLQRSEVFVRDAGSDTARQITRDGASKSNLTLSKDGRHNAFVLDSKAFRADRIVIASDGRVEHEIHFRSKDAGISGLRPVESLVPGMDGEAVGRAIHADRRLSDTRMVMMVPMGMRDVAQRIEAISFAASVTKPVRGEALMNLFSGILSGNLAPDRQGTASRGPDPAKLQPFAGVHARVLVVEDNFTLPADSGGYGHRATQRFTLFETGHMAMLIWAEVPELSTANLR